MSELDLYDSDEESVVLPQGNFEYQQQQQATSTTPAFMSYNGDNNQYQNEEAAILHSDGM